jgi:hypothetical protein
MQIEASALINLQFSFCNLQLLLLSDSVLSVHSAVEFLYGSALPAADHRFALVLGAVVLGGGVGAAGGV